MSRAHRKLPPGLRATNLFRQLPWVGVAGVLTVVLIGLALLAGPVSGGSIDPMDLLSDPAEVTGIAWFVGAVSDLNLFIWAAGAGFYLLAAFGLCQAERRLAAVLALLGAVTLVLLADDRFLLHEIVYPWLFGMPEIVTYALYGAAMAILLLWFGRSLLAQPEAGVLIIALIFLGASVALDVIGWDTTERRILEEAFKLLGASLWSLFPAMIVARQLAAAARVEAPRPVEHDAGRV